MNVDILFFREHMDALPMYERLEEQILAQIPEVKIKVAKTQITFANRRYQFSCVYHVWVFPFPDLTS